MTTSQTVSSARPSRLAALFSVEPGEGRPVASMAGLNFSVSAAFVLVQTSAFALFIETFSAHALPYAYFSVAILSSLIAYAFLQLSRRVSFVSGLYINLAFLTGVCIVFWVGLRTSAARWFIFLLPFWFQTLVILANLVVWHLASHLFHVRQAKRVFGLIVAGNWVANIIGGVLVGSILGLIPAADLYLLAAIAIALSAVVLRAILARHFQQAPPAVPVAAPGSGKRAGFTSVLKHRYARLIFIYTVLWWLELFVLENVFFHQVESQFESSGSLATFLGRQLAVMGVIALFTTSFLTSRVARRYGLRNGLLVMPVLVGVTVMLLVVGGTLGWGTDFLFWMATIARTLNIALGFSISQAMGTLLFQPLLGSLRSAAQTVAEGIMQPLAIGLAGVVLLIFNTTLNLDAVGLSLIFLVVAVPWLWSILQLARRYPLAMGEALRRRSLGDSTVPLFDASSIALLRRHLRDSRPGSALYAMNQLEQLAPQEWARILLEELPQLLAHPSADVRVESLRRVLMLRVTEALPILLGRLEYEQVADVRSMLIRVLATFGNSRSAAEVRKALNASERVVRQGAILGVLSGNGSPDAALALESLRALAVSPDVDDRLAACRVSREVSGPQVLPLLIHLMRDRAVVVRQAALQASASHDDADLLKPLLEATDDPATGRVAERALVAHGPRSIAVLAEGLDQGDDRSITRRQLLSTARILGRIQGRPSLELLRSMMTSRDEELKLEALKSLSRLCYRAESSEQIAAHLHDEVEYAAWLAAARDNLQHVGSPAAWNILANALDISFRDARSRILLFLSFLYDRTAVLRAKGALDHPSATNAPMALETIDALLPSAMKTWILPLMENAALGDAVRRWRLAGIEIADASPGSLLRSLTSVGTGARHASWARLCAIHVAGRTGERGLTSELEAIATGDDPALAAMAHWALNRFSAATAPVGGARMLSLVEKVLILKSAPLFAETPDNVLAEVAGLVEEVSFDADQVIFKKGEAGDSLYVIVSGSVKVWDGERLLNELGEGEVFGELALLDPEPRLATVKCAEPTSLLRLDAPHFREVLDSQPEVSAAIIRVITRYLRSQLQFAREATAKLRALESFTPLDQHAVG